MKTFNSGAFEGLPSRFRMAKSGSYRAPLALSLIGGQLSHGAIVAREYGLPAVVSVARATQHIRDGQGITVDGEAGRVYL